jgi:2,4-dienoyl-CoA reductase-like NADH-dependent reductase (Old Yellow Enzyme family)
MEMDQIAALRDRVESALKQHGISASAFGRKALRDPGFVFDLREGKRSLHLRTITKVEAFIAGLKEPAKPKRKRAA